MDGVEVVRLNPVMLCRSLLRERAVLRRRTDPQFAEQHGRFGR